MARPAGGVEHVVAARELLRSAKTAEELRRAQAVLLPLDLGLSLEQTARAIGRSVNTTCAIRTRFAKVAEGVMAPPQAKTALRNHALADLEREASILDEVLADAQKGGIVVIPQLKPLIEEKVGKPMALSTVYRMLARHGWRKLAPDTYHPQGDTERREV
ncbi:helix-turn-helix domain-containing protein [Acidithiobacillus ferriphilus]|uniref:helix-turn-helix domain-containing protein n=1 Tax=Acidithiobacillus ferriphilus TaxID=1689834 RepID=UPI0040571A55